MAEKRFSEEHEWISVDGDIGTVGISDYAQGQLGDVVFVELPDVGTEVEKGGEIATVESVKAASEVYAPVSGEIVEVNAALEGEPALVNSDAEGDGWFFKIKLNEAGELNSLMDVATYADFAGE